MRQVSGPSRGSSRSGAPLPVHTPVGAGARPPSRCREGGWLQPEPSVSHLQHGEFWGCLQACSGTKWARGAATDRPGLATRVWVGTWRAGSWGSLGCGPSRCWCRPAPAAWSGTWARGCLALASVSPGTQNLSPARGGVCEINFGPTASLWCLNLVPGDCPSTPPSPRLQESRGWRLV